VNFSSPFRSKEGDETGLGLSWLWITCEDDQPVLNLFLSFFGEGSQLYSEKGISEITLPMAFANDIAFPN
jgi:hypothetical protein